MAKQVTAQEAQAPATQNQNTTVAKKETVKSLFESPEIKQRIAAILDKNAPQFITSVIQLVNSDKNLAECKPLSVINAAMTAATLNLPLNNNLGFAYVVPYNSKQADGTWLKEAQFQLGYKGFKQLAQNTGRFSILSQTDVREGELKKQNRLTGEIDFEWIEDAEARLKAKIIGYVSYFKLTNGFVSILYMTDAEIEQHARQYSKVYKKDGTGGGLWKTDRNAMALKTVTKLNISKNAPLSIVDKNLAVALQADQAVIREFNNENQTYDYVDNETQDAEFTDVTHKDKADAAVDATLSKINEKAQGNE